MTSIISCMATLGLVWWSSICQISKQLYKTKMLVETPEIGAGRKVKGSTQLWTLTL